MTARTIPQKPSPSLPVLAIKTVLSKVQTQLNMRSLTAAIRTHTLEGHPHSKDFLLGFFLNCEKKLKRGTQQEWNRVIDHEIRRMVGLQSIQRWMLRRSFNAVSETIRETDQTGDGILQELEGELGEMQISEEVHLKTKYFCQWLQFLQERREIKRLKNKQVQDLKKSKLFCQYSLKFQTFLQWKQQTRKAHSDRDRAKIIQQKMTKRLTNSVFLAIREKIDILTIQGQLADAIRAKMSHLQTKSVFKNLRSNKERQQGKSFKSGNNIWLFRFYRYITQRMTPLQNLSSKNNREKLQENYRKISMQLCWKGFKAILQAKHMKIDQIRAIYKKKAVTDFTDIQKSKKESKKIRTQLIRLRKAICLKEFVQNIEAGNLSFKQYEQKMEAIQAMQIQSGIKQFLLIMKQKTSTNKNIKTCTDSLVQSSINSCKMSVFRCLNAFKSKQGQFSSKQSKAQASVNAMLINFRYKQFKSYKNQTKELHQSLSKYHKKYLISLVFKGFSLYKSISLNQYEALNNIYSSLRIKKLRETFIDIRTHSDLSSKMQKLVFRSEWVVLKVSFVTILNRMLSNKMKIKAFYHQQETKLKGKLFDLLKRNSQYMQEQRQAVQRVAIEFAKARFVHNLRKDVYNRRKEEQMQALRQKLCKRRFFIIFNQGKNCQNQIESKMQETALMLASNRISEFTSSARQFLSYRQNEDRLIYKLQKALVRNIFKAIRKRMYQRKQQKEDKYELQKDHEEKVRNIQGERAGKSLLALLRSKPSTLMEKTQQLRKIRVEQVLIVLNQNIKEKTLKKGLMIAQKTQFIDLLRAEWALSKNTRKFCKKMNKQKAKSALSSLFQNTIDQAEQRSQKTLSLQQWLYESRSKASKKCLISKLSTAYDLKENTLILAKTLIRNGFQRMLKQHLSRRSYAIKEIIALKLYATNLKRRAWRGLRRAGDVQVLKENNRARTEQHSKLSVQKSIQHVRRKSKLMETIERYNQSRVSRVVR